MDAIECFFIYCDNLNKVFVNCSHVSLGFTKPMNLCPLFGWLFPCFLTGCCSLFLFGCALIHLYLYPPPFHFSRSLIIFPTLINAC